MRNDNPMKNCLRWIGNFDWKRGLAFFIQEETIRKLANPSLGTPDLLRRFQNSLAKPATPSSFDGFRFLEVNVFVLKMMM
jgi:hypothetical protein